MGFDSTIRNMRELCFRDLKETQRVSGTQRLIHPLLSQLTDSGYSHLCSNVKVLASREPTNNGSFGPPMHTITAMFFGENCIILDVAFNPRAIVIERNDFATSASVQSMSGHLWSWEYGYISEDSVKTVTLKKSMNTAGERRYFFEIGQQQAIRDITLREAKRTTTGNIPASKTLVIRRTSNTAPLEIPSSPLGSGLWLYYNLQMQIDFLHKQIIMQVPMGDWLLKPEQRYVRCGPSVIDYASEFHQRCKSLAFPDFRSTAANATITFRLDDFIDGSGTTAAVGQPQQQLFQVPVIKTMRLIAATLSISETLFDEILRSLVEVSKFEES
jgi:hypothetical protein